MPGQPDQFPYIDIWQTLAAHPPLLKKCFKDSCKIMMTRSTNTGALNKKKRKRKKASPQYSRCSSARRNGEKLSKQLLIGLRVMAPKGEMMCEPMPRQLFQKLNLHGTQMKQKAKTIYIDIKRL
jgi:hypothetical protein